MRLLNDDLRDRFGCKVYKIALSAKVTCPNRDGTKGDRGCIFCSAGGSGDFAADASLSIPDQIREARARIAHKNPGGKYIAYFQSFTGTYAPLPYLREIFTEAMEPDFIAALSVGTRPDCLGEEVIALLSELNQKKPVWVELGLQTIHERTASYIRRGYPLSVYDRAVRDLKAAGLTVVVHVILGLPGETVSDMQETVRYVCGSGATGIKLQLLHVLRGTDLEKEYAEGKVHVLSEDEYIEILKACVPLVPENVVIHRLTGDGDKRLLLAPLWSGDKKHVWNRIRKEVLSIG